MRNNILLQTFLLLIFICGCKSPLQYRLEADRVANAIVENKLHELGKDEDFTIERPSDIFRRRLLIEQNLPVSGPASFGTDYLEPIDYWPDSNYLEPSFSEIPPLVELQPDRVPKLSMIEALQIGARNSFEYQNRKEDIFRAALGLDLERNEFRNIFFAQADTLVQSDMTTGTTVSGTETGVAAGVSRQLPSGTIITADIAATLANLLTGSKASAFGISSDASVSIPLLRGSGEHIVMEPLIQAERNVVYAIYDFERFRESFAVNVAAEYLGVLRQLDIIKNNEENYRGLVLSARRARRLADAGRLTEVQIDQAVQDELSARDRWISAIETYKRRLDSFKNLIGLPPDAQIELDRVELEKLAEYSRKFALDDEMSDSANGSPASADEPVKLVPPDMENAGPLEIAPELAVKIALENRVDLITAQSQVFDAQRLVVVLADSLEAELTLLGSARTGGTRSINSAILDDIELEFDRGVYSALLTMDLPLERTAERNAYRNSFIALERAVRDVQILEDNIKIGIRNDLRNLLESRESLLIQARSVTLAQKRVKSTNLFLEAGRSEIRDLLEAQEALLSAQNALTAAIINYRIAELELQRDMGVLIVNEKGLWTEFTPGEM